MASKQEEGFLNKIDPQMWLTLIGFVFTLGIIYGEFQTMKNSITIFEEKQKIFDEDFEEEDSETNIENFINNKDFFVGIKENFNGSTVLSILVVLFVIGVVIFLNFFKTPIN